MSSSRVVVADRWSCGGSSAPYDRANVAAHVGDDMGRVGANRRDVAALAGLSLDHVIVMSPVHGNAVAVIKDLDSVPMTALGRVAPQADALITGTTEIGLMVMAADCAPVTISGPSHDGTALVGVVHVGWKGLATQVMSRALSHFVTAHTHVTVHPTICGQHYPVPLARAQEVSADSVVDLGGGNVGIDLRAGIISECQSLGVQRIEIDARCTFETPEFFSHRRESPSGRFGVVAVL